MSNESEIPCIPCNSHWLNFVGKIALISGVEFPPLDAYGLLVALKVLLKFLLATKDVSEGICSKSLRL